MQIFNRYSIKLRLALLGALGLFGMLLISAQSLVQSNEILVSGKQQQIQHLVETVHSLVDSYYTDFKAGNITEAQAQQKVMTAINAMRYDSSNYFWINDETSTIVVHPIKPALNGKNLSSLQDANGKYLFPAFVKKAQENPQGGVVDYLWPKPGSEDPVEKLSFVKEFKPWGWIIGSGIYISDVKESMWVLISNLLIDFVIITSFLLIISFFIAKSIIVPINQTAEALADLAQGEGNLTQRLTINGKDEIAKLSRSFNEFVVKIHRVIKEIQDSAKAVEDSSQELSSLSQKSLQSNEQQSAETTQIATASNEMVNTIHEVADSATTAANLAEGANTEALSSKSIVNDSAQSVQSLSVEITSASSVISELNNECSSIDSVLSVIKAIAEQTNLLALNAAIEAARAGEQGRGFAVVADEVRTLAGRTQEATLEINGIIAQLQTKATEAVSAISNSGELAENAVTQANKASESLDSISAAITAILDANQQIATAADQQSGVTKEIDERVTVIAGLSEESTQHSLKINTGSDDLSKLGTQLRELIKTFQV